MSESELTLTVSENGQVGLVGDISHQSVLNVLSEDILPSKSQITVDFSGVNHSDSSGLALMVRWARQAQKVNAEISFIAVPAKLIALSKMSGLDAILPISAE